MDVTWVCIDYMLFGIYLSYMLDGDIKWLILRILNVGSALLILSNRAMREPLTVE